MSSHPMNRPAPISVFSDQRRTKSTIWSRVSCGTQTPVRVPQEFFLGRRAPPSVRPGPHLWSGSSSPGMRSAPGRRIGLPALSARRRRRHSQRTPSANGRKPWAASRVRRRASRWAPYPADAASGRRPSLPAYSASVASSCALSFTLLGERLLHFQLNRNNRRFTLRGMAGIRGAVQHSCRTRRKLSGTDRAFGHWTCRRRDYAGVADEGSEHPDRFASRAGAPRDDCRGEQLALWHDRHGLLKSGRGSNARFQGHDVSHEVMLQYSTVFFGNDTATTENGSRSERHYPPGQCHRTIRRDSARSGAASLHPLPPVENARRKHSPPRRSLLPDSLHVSVVGTRSRCRAVLLRDRVEHQPAAIQLEQGI